MEEGWLVSPAAFLLLFAVLCWDGRRQGLVRWLIHGRWAGGCAIYFFPKELFDCAVDIH